MCNFALVVQILRPNLVIKVHALFLMKPANLLESTKFRARNTPYIWTVKLNFNKEISMMTVNN